MFPASPEQLEPSKTISSMDMSETKLRDLLEQYQIPIDQWGKGNAKTVADLLEEIKKEESTLVVREREIVRELRAVEIHVTYTDQKTGEILKLFEEKQIFTGGRERKRGYPWSVSGKSHKNENWNQTFRRELRIEELPMIKGKFKKAKPHAELKHISRASNSYPGLSTSYLVKVYDVELTKDQFRPEGYITSESHLTTHFVWKKIENV